MGAWDNIKDNLPTRFVRLGGEFTRYGVTLVCVRRDTCLHHTDACKGCFFSKARNGRNIMNCNDIQCSSFDRMDGLNVWFVPKEGE